MDSTVFSERRRRFLDKLQNGAALLMANPERLRNGDVHYPYRQNSDFLYLTGFPEPESAAVFNPNSETPFVLFVRPKDPQREVWDGKRWGVEAAKEAFGADAVFPIDELETKLPELCASASHLHAPLGWEESIDRLIAGLVARSRRTRQKDGKGPVHVMDPGQILGEMRLIKGPEEIAAMERASEISGEAHRLAMATARPGTWEYQVQAVMEELFRQRGSRRVGYGTIVASGPNATVLHHVENDRRIEDGDLVLIDAGAEFDHYSADITRTFPANGVFTPNQRRIYDIVLKAQQEAIAQAWPGRPWERVHDRARAVIIEGLIDLGFLSGSVEEHLARDDYKKFYMHGTSHWLGMDVHDSGNYKNSQGEARNLEPGMVLTIEPGLYFHAELAEGPEDLLAEFGGIGVRIEDDVLVTEQGPRSLTSVPKTAEEIEELMARGEVSAV